MIFVDTSAWFAAAIVDDPNHASAETFFRTVTSSLLVTSDYVLDETLTLFNVRGAHPFGIALGKQILEGSACRLERVSNTDLHHAYLLYAQSHDRGWSFTDCTSFVMMKRLGITQALAFDAHFEQLGGLEVLPKRG